MSDSEFNERSGSFRLLVSPSRRNRGFLRWARFFFDPLNNTKATQRGGFGWRTLAEPVTTALAPVHFVFTTLGYHPDHIGGAFRYVTEIAEGLARRDHRVDVVFPAARDGAPEPDSFRNGVHLHRLPTPTGIFWRNWLARNRAATEHLRRIRRDDQNAVFVSCHAYLASAVSRATDSFITLFTGPWAEEFRLSGALRSRSIVREKLIAPTLGRVERRGLERSRAIITISRYYQEHLPLWHSAPLPPIHIVPGGVNLAKFSPAQNRAHLRAQYGLAPEEFVLLTVRRLEARMGLSTLLEAFQPVATMFSNSRLWIGGTGPEKENLEAAVQKLGLQKPVAFLGFIPEKELPKRYGAADCAVMPSLDLEGFGLSTVEALACGTPVIGSNRGATPEILQGLDPGLLYNSNGELTAKLRAAMQNPSVLPRRERCRDYATANYDWDRAVAAFESICAAP